MSGASDPFRNLERLRQACGGDWIVSPTADAPVRGASIDSREIGEGDVFFAHRGERTDGHRFVGAALRSGAGLVVVDDPAALDEGVDHAGPVLCVSSVRNAMVDLARARRAAMHATTVIGVTGSSGKTTTTRLIHSVLKQKLRGTASAKSHNNTLGVCLTILNAPIDGEYLVGELGTSAPGELEPLCGLLRPSIGVVTSIGRAHIEGFGSIEAIAREKAALVNGLGTSGVALIASPCPPIEGALRTDAHVVRVGMGEDADLAVREVSMSDRGLSFWAGDSRFGLPAVGAHNALNGAFAIAVGRAMGLDDREIREGLANAELPAMRLQIERIGAITILNDAYNANPDSMLGAIETLEAMEHEGRRVALLGDMLELGDLSESAHREIGERLAQGSVELSVLVGPAMRAAYETLRSSDVCAVHGEDFSSLEGALHAAGQEIRNGDLVLVKGSRGLRMERFVQELRESREPEVGVRSHASISRPA